jgi:hypothetical protein
MSNFDGDSFLKTRSMIRRLWRWRFPFETAFLRPSPVALLIYDEKCMKQWMGYDVTERKQEY